VKSAAVLLGFVISTLQLSPVCRQVSILDFNPFSDQQFTFKVRADLKDDFVLQVRLYCNHDHIDYAYQLLQRERPIQRWNNKEHFPHLASYPHHHHTQGGEVIESSLNGDPEHDLPLVLASLNS
jgi:hypothetical protein